MNDPIVKSRIKPGFVAWFAFLLAGAGFFVWLIVLFAGRAGENGVWATMLWCALFTAMLGAVLLVVRDFRYIRVDTQAGTIFRRSLFAPFSRRSPLTDFTGIVRTAEYGSAGRYGVVYLVGRDMRTALKINGLFYRNFDELVAALQMNELRIGRLTMGRYFRLMFTGRIRISKQHRTAAVLMAAAFICCFSEGSAKNKKDMGKSYFATDTAFFSDTLDMAQYNMNKDKSGNWSYTLPDGTYIDISAFSPPGPCIYTEITPAKKYYTIR